MRLFTALELPLFVRQHLANAQGRIKRGLDCPISWTRQANLHITLKFLGEIAESQIRSLCDALGAVPVPPMTLSLCRLGVLPPRRPARILIAELGGQTDLLLELFDAIERACIGTGLAREGREYHPHITVARLRQPRRIDREIAKVSIEPVEFAVDRFILVQSTLDRAGAIYRPIAAFPARPHT